MASILREKGFVISGVETGRTDSREATTITTAADNTDIFYGMPFPCLILDGGDENQAVVNIGRDYGDARRVDGGTDERIEERTENTQVNE